MFIIDLSLVNNFPLTLAEKKQLLVSSFKEFK